MARSKPSAKPSSKSSGKPRSSIHTSAAIAERPEATPALKPSVKPPAQPRASEAPASEVLRIAVTFKAGGQQMSPAWSMVKAKHFSHREIEQVRPDTSQREKALEVLEKRGFQVTARGALSASICAPAALFEKTFGTRLSRMKNPAASDKPTGKDARISWSRQKTVYYPGADAPWNPDPAVAAIIDEAYIQWPPIYFGAPSAIPPCVATHHLRVPGDLNILLNVSKVHRAGTTGKGVRVAMVDSGFDHGHPFFKLQGFRSSVIAAPGAGSVKADGSGHGTGESANLLSIAPDIEFIGIKTDNEENQSSATILEGLQEAMNHSPKVISISMGYDLRQGNSLKQASTLPNGLVALQAEIQAIVAAGVTVVFSAGNGHYAFPGMMPEVISCGGVYIDAKGARQVSDYASAFVSRPYPGRVVPDVSGLVGMLPDADYIMLPVPPGSELDNGSKNKDGWGIFSGTSAAAPQIAGLCALLLERDPTLKPKDIKSILRRSAHPVTAGHGSPSSDEKGKGRPGKPTAGQDGAAGAGLVDAWEAWKLA